MIPKNSTGQFLGTRAEIFALVAPKDGLEAFATDTEESFIYYNGWQQESTLFKERTGAIDAGAVQNSNLSGYGKNYVSQKHLANITIGGNQETKEGGFRSIFSQTLQKRIIQSYLNGAWQTALTGVNIVADNSETPPDIESTDFAPYSISLITGNSDVKDIDGIPMVQNMKIDAGAVQSPIEINGGIF